MMSHLRVGLILAFLVTAGCGSAQPPPPPTYPVEGQVTYRDGRPVPGGLIEFRAINDPSLTTRAAIESDGKFSLHTLTAREKVMGAIEGPYEVTIHPPPSEAQDALPITLRERYTVQPGENHFAIVIDAPGNHGRQRIEDRE